MTDLVFIASGGRTGTQLLGHRLKEVIAESWSEHEPDMVAGLSRLTLDRIRRFGLWHMTGARLTGRSGVRVIGQDWLRGRIGRDTAIARLRAGRAAYHAGHPEPLIIESYYAWWMVAELIPEAFPGARLIGVVRDPRDWIASWRARAPGRRTEGPWERLLAHPLRPADFGEALDWRHRTPEERLAWDWRLVTTTLERAGARIFRFEDITDPAASALRDLALCAADHGARRYAVGDTAPLLAARLNRSRARPLAWHDWPPERARAVATLCGPAMARHGYGDEPEWQALLRAADHPPAAQSHRKPTL